MSHKFYLTKNIQPEVDGMKNVLFFNDNNIHSRAKWIAKNIDAHNGSLIVLDHNCHILNNVQRNLQKKNYYIETVDMRRPHETIHINPFDIVTNIAEIHFLFLNFLYAMWDNTDDDIPAMTNLIDALASLVFYMFKDTPQKRNMYAMKKMVSSLTSICNAEDGSKQRMTDAIFANFKDQDAMPCKYYTQYKRFANDREDVVANKVVELFSMFTENELEMMSKTDAFLKDSFEFKTAVFLNVNKETEEKTSRLILILLNAYIQTFESNELPILFVFDNLNAQHVYVSLPQWMLDANQQNIGYLVVCDNMTQFTQTDNLKKYFENIKNSVCASVLAHHNENISTNNNLPSTFSEMNAVEEIVATVLYDDTMQKDIL